MQVIMQVNGYAQTTDTIDRPLYPYTVLPLTYLLLQRLSDLADHLRHPNLAV